MNFVSTLRNILTGNELGDIGKIAELGTVLACRK